MDFWFFFSQTFAFIEKIPIFSLSKIIFFYLALFLCQKLVSQNREKDSSKLSGKTLVSLFPIYENLSSAENDNQGWISRRSIASSMHFRINDSCMRWRSHESESYSHVSVKILEKTMPSRSASVRTVERYMMSMLHSWAHTYRVSAILVWSHVVRVS